MGLSPENIVVVYRQGDADSLAFARHYQAFRKLDDDQLIGVPCSASEVLLDYATFQSEIEHPLMDVVFDPYYGRQVFAVLVGYNVPGGFFHGSDIISATSRLSRMTHAFSPKTGNPIFDRKDFKPYGASDSALTLIVSRIDAPSLTLAKSVIDNTAKYIKQGLANGTFFFDKYRVASAFDQQETFYENDLVNFEDAVLPVLNMPVYKTTFWDEYKDVPVPQLKNDSFMWAWGSPRAGYTYFEDSRPNRVFLYNADEDGAGTVRDPDDKRFPMLALTRGYVGTAGAMTDPTPSGYLRPKPFFEALFRGVTVGEAFTFACPHVDWTMTLFGDPLVTVRFPKGGVIETGLTTDTAWDVMLAGVTDAVAYSYKRQLDYPAIQQIIVQYTDQTKLDLFSVMSDLVAEESGKWNNAYQKVVPDLLAFPVGGSANTGTPLQDYLSARGVGVSALLPIAATVSIPSAYTINEGYWQADYTIQGSGVDYTVYNFQLQVSLYKDFSVLLHDFTTAVSPDNWQYEKERGSFAAFPSVGVPSSYIGRRVRYTSPQSQYLDRCTLFYFRFRQIDSLGGTSAWQTFQSIVSS